MLLYRLKRYIVIKAIPNFATKINLIDEGYVEIRNASPDGYRQNKVHLIHFTYDDLESYSNKNNIVCCLVNKNVYTIAYKNEEETKYTKEGINKVYDKLYVTDYYEPIFPDTPRPTLHNYHNNRNDYTVLYDEYTYSVSTGTIIYHWNYEDNILESIDVIRKGTDIMSDRNVEYLLKSNRINITYQRNGVGYLGVEYNLDTNKTCICINYFQGDNNTDTFNLKYDESENLTHICDVNNGRYYIKYYSK